MMSNRLQSGVNTLQGFREDKRNRVTQGTLLLQMFRHDADVESSPSCWLSFFFLFFFMSRCFCFPQCPTSTTGPSPPTLPPTTPASPTSARRSPTSSTLLTATSPVRGAQTGMCSADALALCGIHTKRQEAFLNDCFPDASVFH